MYLKVSLEISCELSATAVIGALRVKTLPKYTIERRQLNI